MSGTGAFPYRTSVSSAAASKDLTVKATVKTEIGLSGTTHDDFIDALIHQASATIVSYIGRDVASETLVDRFRCDGSPDFLYLSRWPVGSITSVTEDGTAVTSTYYELDAVTGKLWRLDDAGDGERTTWESGVYIVVTYVAGWTLLTTEPHDIERCCIDLVKAWYYARSRDPLVRSKAVPDVYSEAYQIGGNMESAPGGIPGDIAGRLDAYRLPAVA